MPSITSCRFFATDAIENEMKPLCPNDKETKIRIIEEIMNDPICERFYGHIPVEKLNPLLRENYKLIHEKKAEKILTFTARYRKKQAWIEKKWKPLVRKICSTRLYEAIRGR